ncbi:hypothetical protein [Parachitinimonas caeni]|uniref:HAMP domain-containing protein n=1 Tax=Parachitinimonas caeni TaxID=3031301 RepID=A0ABT7DVI9_9NEIS|nr:hypothetical protein [Parachitinimonas caeni]MDK2124080.1 hypothetical protein [Parachitinimonas caeni]
MVWLQRTALDTSQRERFRVMLTDLREKVETDLNLGFDLTDDRGAQDRLEQLITQDRALEAAEIFDVSGLSLFNTDRGSIQELVPPSWLKATHRLSDHGIWMVRDGNETVLGLPIRNAFGETAGHLALTFQTHPPDEYVQTQKATIIGAIAAGVTLLLALLGFYRLVWRITGRVASEMASSNPNRPFFTTNQTLEQLATRLDDALSTLESEERRI